MERNQQAQFFEIVNRIDFAGIRKHPNILVAASFWEEERYRAAKTFYRFMRRIDDLVDDRKAVHDGISDKDRVRLTVRIGEWLDQVRNPRNRLLFKPDLARVIGRFKMPLWPCEDFAASMLYDISHDGFPTLESFLEYSSGASVAPSSIFVHLCGLRRSGDSYLEPPFDVRKTATPCALFSYLVHIIRDFQKDQLQHLNYFSDDVLVRHGLTRRELLQMANGSGINAGFRDMIREYLGLADGYRKQTVEVIKEISPLLEPCYALSLKIIFNLYLMVFERIDPDRGTFTTGEMNPTPAEIRQRVLDTIQGFRE